MAQDANPNDPESGGADADRSSPTTCVDLDKAIADHEASGYRLQALGPADDPCWAELAAGDRTVVIETVPGAAAIGRRLVVPAAVATAAVAHESGGDWVTGRAGMRYRDLVPDRHGGAYIASHIHVPEGGPVPDYVHHHAIAYQLIFCHRGWVRVVYEDQGPPFALEPGDCVLQPPGIRHQVLESSPDLYVVEISCPAEHRTSLDHSMRLPTDAIDPTRSYGGQRFVHHVTASSDWSAAEDAGPSFRQQPTAIADATDGLAAVRVVLAEPPVGSPVEPWSLRHDDDFRFLFLLV